MNGHTSAGADVVVVGGGPAGCAAALAARRGGAHVVLLERDSVARDRPGETLAPGVEPLIEWLGAGDALANATLARHEGHWAETSAEKRYVRFGSDAAGPWRGFQVWRSTFDAGLRRVAADRGVEVRTGAAASALASRFGGVRGVVLRTGEQLGARVVIDASGGRHWLARSLGLGVARLSPRYVATYGYAGARDPRPASGARRGARPAAPRDPVFTFDRDGWTWVAPIGERGWAWTRLSLAGKKTTRPGLLRGLRPTAAARGADVTWRIARSVAGPGWLIAGDAGAVLDPAAAHGVLRALMSGTRAGHAAALVCRAAGTADPALAFTGYDGWFRAGVLRDAAILRGIYGSSVASLRMTG